MNIDISIIIGAIGLVLTGYSVYLVLKKKKYPGKLTFVKESSVGLFNELANTFEEIKIQFKGLPIDKNIIYVKASIINNGETDLNLREAENPVTLNLTKDLSWIKSKITKSSKNINCNTIVNTEKNELTFDCGILKINEFFQFEALIETKNEKISSSNIFDEIQATHRLINTQKITKTSYLNEKERQKKKSSVKSHIFFIIIMLVVYSLAAVYQSYFSASTKFLYKNESEIYKVTPLTDMTIEIEGETNDIEKIITISEFTKNYSPFIPVKSFLDYLFESYKFLIVMIALYFLLIFWDYLELRKSRQISDIIQKELKITKHNNV